MMNKSSRDPNGDNFRKLAEKRTANLIKAIRNLKKLSNKNHYSYTEEEVNHMVRSIRNEVTHLDNAFKNNNSSSEKVFSFKK